MYVQAGVSITTTQSTTAITASTVTTATTATTVDDDGDDVGIYLCLENIPTYTNPQCSLKYSLPAIGLLTLW